MLRKYLSSEVKGRKRSGMKRVNYVVLVLVIDVKRLGKGWKVQSIVLVL